MQTGITSLSSCQHIGETWGNTKDEFSIAQRHCQPGAVHIRFEQAAATRVHLIAQVKANQPALHHAIAARLSGTRAWQVLIVLYVMSAVMAAIADLLFSGLTNTASVSLVDASLLPSVAAAVIGGTSILGGRGGFGGTIVGALILTVLTALLTVLGLPEPSRQVLFGAIIVVVAAAYTRVTAEA